MSAAPQCADSQPSSNDARLAVKLKEFTTAQLKRNEAQLKALTYRFSDNVDQDVLLQLISEMKESEENVMRLIQEIRQLKGFKIKDNKDIA